MNMRVNPSASALAFCLLFALYSQTFSAIVSADPPTACCFTYASKKIPRNLLKTYYETSSMCSQPGIVFVTKRGIEQCANPADKWVQAHKEYLKNKRD